MKSTDFISSGLLCFSSKDFKVAKSVDRINSHPTRVSIQQKNPRINPGFLCRAGLEGIEPPSRVLETRVLPLNDSPKF